MPSVFYSLTYDVERTTYYYYMVIIWFVNMISKKKPNSLKL